jgi:glyoxylate reductase
MKVFVTRRLPGGALDRLAAEHDLDVWPEQLPPARAELLSRAPELEGLLSLLTDRIDAELIGGAPRLRAISNYAVGVDNIDLEAAAARGIQVGNTPGVLTDTTADFAVALMLGISRHLAEGDAYVRRGEWRTWEPGLLLGHDLHGATVGIVGFGRIGRAVGRRLEGFGCEILHTSRTGATRVPLEELLERSDFVTLHAPLTAETRGLIGDRALARMKPTAYLINTARGPIVDSEALVRALHAGAIAGAALDVTDPEPLPAGHPLLDAPNLLVLPHLGSATYATRERMADMAVDNLLAGLAGERMPHSVT